MNPAVRSNLISGVIAAVIYVAIAIPTGQSPGPAIAFGVGLGVFTFIVAFLISRALGARGRT